MVETGNKKDMKQTVEAAASENILFNHRTVDRTLFGKDLAKFGEINFIQGAEWQSKQSPWISVKERLPEPNKLVLCRMVSNGAIVSGYIVVSPGRSPYVATDGGFEFEDWNDYECDMWMPIPSFDEYLCNVMGCFCFVSRGKVTDIKTEKEEQSCVIQ